MTKGKRGYKRCSVKGCRKKAVTKGKCREHAQKKPSPLSLEKEISDPALTRTAKKIKMVRKSAGAFSKRVKKKVPCRREGYWDALCFEAGIILGKFSRWSESGQ